MRVQNIVPKSIIDLGTKSLLSNHYMLAFFKKFCTSIGSLTWKFTRAKNARYEDQDFLKVFFYSEILGRSIHDASELLNEYLLESKKGRRNVSLTGGESALSHIKPR